MTIIFLDQSFGFIPSHLEFESIMGNGCGVFRQCPSTPEEAAWLGVAPHLSRPGRSVANGVESVFHNDLFYFIVMLSFLTLTWHFIQSRRYG